MNRLNRMAHWVLGAATIGVLSLLCWHVIDLYRLGMRPENLSETGVLLSPIFTWENVTERLSSMTFWLLGYAVIVLNCLALHLRTPEEKSPRLRPDDETLLRLRKRAVGFLPENAIGVIGLPAQAVREENFRRRMTIGMTIILLPVALKAASYLLNPANFTSWELESVLGGVLLHVGLPVLLILTAACVTSMSFERSIRRELKALQGMPTVKTEAPSKAKKAFPVTTVRVVLLAAAVVMIIDGVSNGGLRDVLIKAINICTECIGLG